VTDTVRGAANRTASLVYFESWTDPIAGEILDDDDAIRVTRLSIDGDVEENWVALERAHGYQALIRTDAARRPGVAEQWLPDADVIARCEDLLAVCSAGAGYDVVDVDACTASGVIVCNNAGPGREAVAEHALGFMLSLAKKIGLADRLMRRSTISDRSVLRGSELRGKALGVVGVGQIGSRLIELCRPFEMTVLAVDPYLEPTEAAARGATLVELDELLERADFVHLNCPLTADTEGLIGRAQFARMKPTAFFITTARGPVHDEDALVHALESGQIAGAGIDVFHVEPPPADHPLLALDNVIASPHTAGITVEAARDIAVATAEQWRTIFAGGVPPRLLNPTAWPRYVERFSDRLGFRPNDLEP
jgi:D-3-phosphoglycerate dehydrogenase / 2-oxoglutarate reductase